MTAVPAPRPDQDMPDDSTKLMNMILLMPAMMRVNFLTDALKAP